MPVHRVGESEGEEREGGESEAGGDEEGLSSMNRRVEILKEDLSLGRGGERAD